MSATLSAGVNSLILKLDTPYDTIRTWDVRDDLIKVKVWCSTTANFTPVDTGTAGANQVFDGLSLSIVISKLADGTALTAGISYYVKYAFISDIDETVYTVSSQLSATPVAATSQILDISGFTSFLKSDETTFTPANVTLTAVTTGITNPVYSWTVNGATPTSGTSSTITITPNASNGTGVGVTLSVTGTGIVTPISKSITLPIAYVPPTYSINNYGAVFRRDIEGNVYPSTGVILESAYSKFKSSPQPTFVWKKDNVVISGATNFSYTVPASDFANSTEHTYTSIVTGQDLGGNNTSISTSVQITRIDDGSKGPRSATGYLYYQTAVATAPGTPSASNYNFNTGQFATLASASGDTGTWGYSPISPSTSDTTLKTWVSRYSVIEPGYGIATGAAIISAPSANISFNGIVTFTNYASGATPLATAASVNSKLSATDLGATGTTVIDGGRITTGIIAAGRLDLSGVLTATSVSNTGTTQIDGGRIKTGIIDADRLNLSGVLKVGSTNADSSVNTTTQINGGSIQTGSINADRLSIGQTTSTNRIRLYDNKIEVWADNGSGTSVRRVVLGDLS